jgi:hypothetical protein
MPRVALDPPLELGEWDEHQLAAEDDLEVRLNPALEVVDAHAQRSGRFLSRQGVAGDCGKRTGRARSHLSGVFVADGGMGSSRWRRFSAKTIAPLSSSTA